MTKKFEYIPLDLTEFVTPTGEPHVFVMHEWVPIDGIDLKLGDHWVWSVGKHKVTGKIFVSTDSRFYGDPNFECLWLR